MMHIRQTWSRCYREWYSDALVGAEERNGFSNARQQAWAAEFQATFGVQSVAAFYADLNAWLVDPAAPSIVPPNRTQVEDLFRNGNATFPVPLISY